MGGTWRSQGTCCVGQVSKHKRHWAWSVKKRLQGLPKLPANKTHLPLLSFQFFTESFLLELWVTVGSGGVSGKKGCSGDSSRKTRSVEIPVAYFIWLLVRGLILGAKILKRISPLSKLMQCSCMYASPCAYIMSCYTYMHVLYSHMYTCVDIAISLLWVSYV